MTEEPVSRRVLAGEADVDLAVEPAIRPEQGMAVELREDDGLHDERAEEQQRRAEPAGGAGSC